ncbi:MAG: hypothetical protein NTU76_02890 [Candidatus Taylorbacteria bacterium]|nr:hypothetical protein [Candidatus Taylorbacteria bacterium]
MKKSAVMMVLMFLFAKTAISGDNPLWTLSSKEAILSYAMGQVCQGSVSVWAPSSVYGGEVFTNSAHCSLPVIERKDAFKVLSMLKQEQIYFSVARPDVDWINSYIGLYDNEGREMLYGYGWGKLSITLGEWVPPQSLLKFDTYLAWKIPLLKGVTQARVLLRDKSGNVIKTEYLDVDENGKIMFTRDFVGQNGEIIATMEDGSSIVASLSDDKVYEIIGVSAKIDASIQGVSLIPDNAVNFKVTPISRNGYGESPLIRGNLEKGWFTLRAMTTEGEISCGVWFRNVESPEGEWQYQEGDLDTDIPISQKGTYELILNWEFFGPFPMNYYDGGGKG